jgi:hypothetical protein
MEAGWRDSREKLMALKIKSKENYRWDLVSLPTILKVDGDKPVYQS